MTGIETKNRLLKAKANKEKSIANIGVENENKVITYSKQELSLNTISSIIPIARKKVDSIGSAIDYMEYVRKKPKNESIVVSLAKPRKIVSSPTDTVENIIVKGVSMPIKSYSSTSVTKLLSGFLNGFDVLMSQSISLVFGLLINFGTELHKFKKKGTSYKHFKNITLFLIVQFVITLMATILVGINYKGRLAAITAIIFTLFFFILRNILKIIQKKKDIKTGLLIDDFFENSLYEKTKEKINF